ncbi:hypothetical protein RND71_020643 [Anisodus tanguticus]|uniref:DUF4283 domain-containing protein n=1 Tax=Anisodus tanguticus TaxID=243964 RepID=A0AAE1VFJ8_9SOLA|nr:hypothetical protein RND71_020643 [Anisodus tanguticus]
MAIPATGRPPPEVGHHPPNPAHPLDYSNLFKATPTIPPLQISETANGGNPRPCGDPSPMSIPIPIKPIVYLHGEPTIRFEKKKVEVMIHHQELTLAIVGKFSHGWPDIAFLRNAIPKQCGLKAEVRIGLLCDRHVLIRCSIVEDFDTLMSRQTFEIKEKNKPYLMRTFKWDISFNPAEESRFAYGWISFPGLSPHYYGESTLFSLAAAWEKEMESHPNYKKLDMISSQNIVPIASYKGMMLMDVGTYNKLRPEKAKEIDGGKVGKAVETAAAIGKGKASIPTSSSSNPSQQAPISTTNALIQHPSNNWIPNTLEKQEKQESNSKTTLKTHWNSNSATGTVFPESRAIGTTVQVAETVFPPKNDPPKFSDAGNPTGNFGGAGNPTGYPTGTLGGAGNLPETLPATLPQELEVTIHHQELQHSVVGKFSHGWPEIHYLRTEIPKQCELKAEVKIGLLCNRHVLIRCSLFEDYVTLMSKPCFLIQENRKYHPMRTFKWEPWFNAEEESSIAHTWISFPGLAPNFYNEPHLFSFAAAVESHWLLMSLPRTNLGLVVLSRQSHIPPPPATNPTTNKEWITVRRKPNKNRKQKQPSNPTKNSGVDIGTVIPAVLAIGNIDTESPQPIATQNLADKATGNPTQSVGNQRNTADSPTKTLAATPENPKQIANPTRPGNPTHNLTHPTPSNSTIGNHSGLPIPPSTNPNPNQTQPSPSPKPLSLAVSATETLPDTTQTSSPTRTENPTHISTHPPPPTSQDPERDKVEEDTEEWLHKQRASLQDIALTKPVPKKKTPKQVSTPVAQKKDKAPRRKYPTWTPALERALAEGYNPYAGENEYEWRR